MCAHSNVVCAVSVICDHMSYVLVVCFETLAFVLVCMGFT